MQFEIIIVNLNISAILAWSRSRNFFYAYFVLKTLTSMVCEGSVHCLTLAYVVKCFCPFRLLFYKRKGSIIDVWIPIKFLDNEFLFFRRIIFRRFDERQHLEFFPALDHLHSFAGLSLLVFSKLLPRFRSFLLKNCWTHLV